MLEGWVSDILAAYLGNFIDVKKEKLRISLWSGLVLEHVKLRVDAFDHLDLPFTIREGSIAKLQLQVPWRSLTAQSVVVELSDIVLHADPHAEEQWAAPAAEQRRRASQQAAVSASQLQDCGEAAPAAAPAASAEPAAAAAVAAAVAGSAGGPAASDRSAAGSSFGGGLLSRLLMLLVQRLFIRINGVHVFFKDDEGDGSGGGRCQFGLTLDRLGTCDRPQLLRPFSGFLAGRASRTADAQVVRHLLVERCGLYWTLLRGKDDAVEVPAESWIVEPVDGMLELSLGAASGAACPGTDLRPAVVVAGRLLPCNMQASAPQLASAMLFLDRLYSWQRRSRYARFRRLDCSGAAKLFPAGSRAQLRQSSCPELAGLSRAVLQPQGPLAWEAGSARSSCEEGSVARTSSAVEDAAEPQEVDVEGKSIWKQMWRFAFRAVVHDLVQAAPEGSRLRMQYRRRYIRLLLSPGGGSNPDAASSSEEEAATSEDEDAGSLSLSSSLSSAEAGEGIGISADESRRAGGRVLRTRHSEPVLPGLQGVGTLPGSPASAALRDVDCELELEQELLQLEDDLPVKDIVHCRSIAGCVASRARGRAGRALSGTAVAARAPASLLPQWTTSWTVLGGASEAGPTSRDRLLAAPLPPQPPSQQQLLELYHALDADLQPAASNDEELGGPGGLGQQPPTALLLEVDAVAITLRLHHRPDPAQGLGRAASEQGVALAAELQGLRAAAVLRPPGLMCAHVALASALVRAGPEASGAPGRILMQQQEPPLSERQDGEVPPLMLSSFHCGPAPTLAALQPLLRRLLPQPLLPPSPPQTANAAAHLAVQLQPFAALLDECALLRMAALAAALPRCEGSWGRSVGWRHLPPGPAQALSQSESLLPEAGAPALLLQMASGSLLLPCADGAVGLLRLGPASLRLPPGGPAPQQRVAIDALAASMQQQQQRPGAAAAAAVSAAQRQLEQRSLQQPLALQLARAEAFVQHAPAATAAAALPELLPWAEAAAEAAAPVLQLALRAQLRLHRLLPRMAGSVEVDGASLQLAESQSAALAHVGSACARLRYALQPAQEPLREEGLPEPWTELEVTTGFVRALYCNDQLPGSCSSSSSGRLPMASCFMELETGMLQVRSSGAGVELRSQLQRAVLLDTSHYPPAAAPPVQGAVIPRLARQMVVDTVCVDLNSGQPGDFALTIGLQAPTIRGYAANGCGFVQASSQAGSEPAPGFVQYRTARSAAGSSVTELEFSNLALGSAFLQRVLSLIYPPKHPTDPSPSPPPPPPPPSLPPSQRPLVLELQVLEDLHGDVDVRCLLHPSAPSAHPATASQHESPSSEQCSSTSWCLFLDISNCQIVATAAGTACEDPDAAMPPGEAPADPAATRPAAAAGAGSSFGDDASLLFASPLATHHPHRNSNGERTSRLRKLSSRGLPDAAVPHVVLNIPALQLRLPPGAAGCPGSRSRSFDDGHATAPDEHAGGRGEGGSEAAGAGEGDAFEDAQELSCRSSCSAPAEDSTLQNRLQDETSSSTQAQPQHPREASRRWLRCSMELLVHGAAAVKRRRFARFSAASTPACVPCGIAGRADHGNTVGGGAGAGDSEAMGGVGVHCKEADLQLTPSLVRALEEVAGSQLALWRALRQPWGTAKQSATEAAGPRVWGAPLRLALGPKASAQAVLLEAERVRLAVAEDAGEGEGGAASMQLQVDHLQLAGSCGRAAPLPASAAAWAQWASFTVHAVQPPLGAQPAEASSVPYARSLDGSLWEASCGAGSWEEAGGAGAAGGAAPELRLAWSPPLPQHGLKSLVAPGTLPPAAAGVARPLPPGVVMQDGPHSGRPGIRDEAGLLSSFLNDPAPGGAADGSLVRTRAWCGNPFRAAAALPPSGADAGSRAMAPIRSLLSAAMALEAGRAAEQAMTDRQEQEGEEADDDDDMSFYSAGAMSSGLSGIGGMSPNRAASMPFAGPRLQFGSRRGSASLASELWQDARSSYGTGRSDGATPSPFLLPRRSEPPEDQQHPASICSPGFELLMRSAVAAAAAARTGSGGGRCWLFASPLLQATDGAALRPLIGEPPGASGQMEWHLLLSAAAASAPPGLLPDRSFSASVELRPYASHSAATAEHACPDDADEEALEQRADRHAGPADKCGAQARRSWEAAGGEAQYEAVVAMQPGAVFVNALGWEAGAAAAAAAVAALQESPLWLGFDAAQSNSGSGTPRQLRSCSSSSSSSGGGAPDAASARAAVACGSPTPTLEVVACRVEPVALSLHIAALPPTTGGALSGATHEDVGGFHATFHSSHSAALPDPCTSPASPSSQPAPALVIRATASAQLRAAMRSIQPSCQICMPAVQVGTGQLVAEAGGVCSVGGGATLVRAEGASARVGKVGGAAAGAAAAEVVGVAVGLDALKFWVSEAAVVPLVDLAAALQTSAAHASSVLQRYAPGRDAAGQPAGSVARLRWNGPGSACARQAGRDAAAEQQAELHVEVSVRRASLLALDAVRDRALPILELALSAVQLELQHGRADGQLEAALQLALQVWTFDSLHWGWEPLVDTWTACLCVRSVPDPDGPGKSSDCWMPGPLGGRHMRLRLHSTQVLELTTTPSAPVSLSQLATFAERVLRPQPRAPPGPPGPPAATPGGGWRVWVRNETGAALSCRLQSGLHRPSQAAVQLPHDSCTMICQQESPPPHRSAEGGHSTGLAPPLFAPLPLTTSAKEPAQSEAASGSASWAAPRVPDEARLLLRSAGAPPQHPASSIALDFDRSTQHLVLALPGVAPDGPGWRGASRALPLPVVCSVTMHPVLGREVLLHSGVRLRNRLSVPLQVRLLRPGRGTALQHEQQLLLQPGGCGSVPSTYLLDGLLMMRPAAAPAGATPTLSPPLTPPGSTVWDPNTAAAAAPDPAGSGTADEGADEEAGFSHEYSTAIAVQEVLGRALLRRLLPHQLLRSLPLPAAVPEAPHHRLSCEPKLRTLVPLVPDASRAAFQMLLSAGDSKTVDPDAGDGRSSGLGDCEVTVVVDAPLVVHNCLPVPLTVMLAHGGAAAQPQEMRLAPLEKLLRYHAVPRPAHLPFSSLYVILQPEGHGSKFINVQPMGVEAFDEELWEGSRLVADLQVEVPVTTVPAAAAAQQPPTTQLSFQALSWAASGQLELRISCGMWVYNYTGAAIALRGFPVPEEPISAAEEAKLGFGWGQHGGDGGEAAAGKLPAAVSPAGRVMLAGAWNSRRDRGSSSSGNGGDMAVGRSVEDSSDGSRSQQTPLPLPQQQQERSFGARDRPVPARWLGLSDGPAGLPPRRSSSVGGHSSGPADSRRTSPTTNSWSRMASWQQRASLDEQALPHLQDWGDPSWTITPRPWMCGTTACRLHGSLWLQLACSSLPGGGTAPTWSDAVTIDSLSHTAVVAVPCNALTGGNDRNAGGPGAAQDHTAVGEYVVRLIATRIPSASFAWALYTMPQYIIRNHMDMPLLYRQQGTHRDQVLAPGAQQAVVWADRSLDRKLSVRVQEAGWQWSGSFGLDGPGDLFVKVRQRDRGQATKLLHVDVDSRAACGTTTATISTRVPAGFAPYRLDNLTCESIHVHQKEVLQEDILRPYCSLLYAWDEPSLPHTLIVQLPGRLPLAALSLDVGEQVEVCVPAGRHSSPGPPGSRVFRLVVHADGPTRVLAIIDTQVHITGDISKPQSPLYRPRPPLTWSSWSGSATAAAPAVDDDGSIRPSWAADLELDLDLDLVGVGLSLTTRDSELLYCRLSQLRFRWTTTRFRHMFEMAMKSIQVDNCQPGAAYPVMLRSPVQLPLIGSGVVPDTSSSSALVRCAVWRRQPAGVLCCEVAALRMARFTIAIELRTLQRVLDHLRVLATAFQGLPAGAPAPRLAAGEQLVEAARAMHPGLQGGPPGAAGGSNPWPRKVYVESLELSAVPLTVSFAPPSPWDEPGTAPAHGRADAGDGESSRPSKVAGGGPGGTEQDQQTGWLGLLMSLADVNGANVSIAPLQLAHQLLAPTAFLDKIATHLLRSLLLEAYKVLGAADVLGDPVTLIHHLRLGVWSLITTPVQGLAIGTRTRWPWEVPVALATGLWTGLQSALLSTVFGTSNATAKMAASVYKTLLVLGLASPDQPEALASSAAGRSPLLDRPLHPGLYQSSYRASHAPEPELALLDSTGRAGSAGGGSVGGPGEGGTLGALLQGLAGLVAAPVQETKRQGMAGLLPGLGKGALRAVALPLAGLLQTMASTAESVRRFVDSSPGQLPRTRLPRHVSPAAPLAPFQEASARGAMLLQQVAGGQLAGEHLLGCFAMQAPHTFALLTDNHLMCCSLKPDSELPAEHILVRLADVLYINVQDATHVQLMLLQPDGLELPAAWAPRGSGPRATASAGPGSQGGLRLVVLAWPDVRPFAQVHLAVADSAAAQKLAEMTQAALLQAAPRCSWKLQTLIVNPGS